LSFTEKVVSLQPKAVISHANLTHLLTTPKPYKNDESKFTIAEKAVVAGVTTASRLRALSFPRGTGTDRLQDLVSLHGESDV
jgi:hypothetical protein